MPTSYQVNDKHRGLVFKVFAELDTSQKKIDVFNHYSRFFYEW